MPLRPIPTLLSLLCLASALPARAANTDAEGCHDPRLVSRIPGATILECAVHEYDELGIPMGAKGEPETVSGATAVLRYWAPNKSAIQVVRNYQAALVKIGFGVVWQNGGGGEREVALRRTLGARATVYVATREYRSDCEIRLTVVEEQAMTQQISADASALREQLERDGHVALHGVLFATGEATLTQDSEATLAQVAGLLTSDAGLRVRIEGHTDDRGKGNLDLSRRRARAVHDWLVAHGVAAARLSSEGYGDGRPVADNGTEEGRARNRRVELVKL